MTTKTNELEKKIDNMEWTLFDRFLYGGLGHGYFCFPTNLVRIIFTVIFPPIGIILKHLHVSTTFPYITGDTVKNLVANIDDIIYSFVLTAMFYIPGLIYGLSGLRCVETSDENKEKLRDVTEKDIRDHFQNIKMRNAVKTKLAN
jgi:uncharacterized membrane protein YqaE (UPF0057 family)